ncbi:MAG: ABC transporter permease [Acidobacteriota bacterium]
MAVYERTYRRYEGSHTPAATRFLILPRYIFQDVFKSRWLVAFFAFCFLYPMVCAAILYLLNNQTFREAFPNFQLPTFLDMESGFLLSFLRIQGVSAFALSVFIGPGLVSRDLANNGLALYLSRPFTRFEYVIGKLSVLALLLSAITWVAGSLLILLYANFVGFGWIFEQAGLIAGFLVSSWLLILGLGMMSLSISALVKWRSVAGFAMVALVLGGAFFGSVMINELFRTTYGHMLNLALVMVRLWEGLMGAPSTSPLSMPAAVLGLSLFLLGFTFLLFRKIRAYEVVG